MSSTSEKLAISLIGPRIWQKLLQAETERLRTARARQVTATIVAMLHSRHVGVTPAIAAGLAVPAAEGIVPDQAAQPWRAVFERLRRELRRTLPDQDLAGAALAESDGFRLADSLSYTILRLALPLVARACRNIGKSILFCADDVAGDEDYVGYSANLAHQLEHLATSDLRLQQQDDEISVFWAELALTLASRIHTTIPGRATAPLAQTKPSGLGWLLRLRPDPEPRANIFDRPRVMTTHYKRQASRRLNEGGVTGYRYTRRIEDLSGIVLSEFLYPDDIRLDRLLNSGYLAIERPPRQQKRRDVLVVGMMPPELRRHPSAEFLKACWFDCMWRFSVFLRSHDLYHSEIRWIEGDMPERFRSTSYHLHHIPHLPHDEQFNQRDRWMFLKSQHWVPSFLNQRDRYESMKRLDGSAQPKLETAWNWCLAAWDAQRDTQAPTATINTRRAWRDVVAEFAHVHVMTLLPVLAPANPEDRPEVRAWQHLSPRLGLASSAGGYLLVTWTPEHPQATSQWRFVSRGEVMRVSDAAKTPAMIAGCLEQLWLERLIKDMRRA